LVGPLPARGRKKRAIESFVVLLLKRVPGKEVRFRFDRRKDRP
jgi:hypothetical protein